MKHKKQPFAYALAVALLSLSTHAFAESAPKMPTSLPKEMIMQPYSQCPAAPTAQSPLQTILPALAASLPEGQYPVVALGRVVTVIFHLSREQAASGIASTYHQAEVEQFYLLTPDGVRTLDPSTYPAGKALPFDERRSAGPPPQAKDGLRWFPITLLSRKDLGQNAANLRFSSAESEHLYMRATVAGYAWQACAFALPVPAPTELNVALEQLRQHYFQGARAQAFAAQNASHLKAQNGHALIVQQWLKTSL